MGAFIVFEGGEGAGKTTQAAILARRLSREGYQRVLTHEPGGTPLGEAVRRWVKRGPGLTPLAELLLFTAARAQHVEEVIAPALGSGQVVICDRFVASTVAYQGYGRGLDIGLIEQLSQAATRGLTPDLTLLLDIRAEGGLGRKPVQRGDTFESEAQEFHERVRKGYHAQAASDPQRWHVVDGTLGKDDVAAAVWEKVQPLLSRRG